MSDKEKAVKFFTFLAGVAIIIVGLDMIHPGLAVVAIGAAICWLSWF